VDGEGIFRVRAPDNVYGAMPRIAGGVAHKVERHRANVACSISVCDGRAPRYAFVRMRTGSVVRDGRSGSRVATTVVW
jgi:hypothetical protein